jgi:AcrR family transcriptional regulator
MSQKAKSTHRESVRKPSRAKTPRKQHPRILAEPPVGRGRATYDKLMKAAGELLGEVGFEKLTTNAVCARAGLTPPALYRYFHDKYDVLEALARRLLKKQNDAYAAWFVQSGPWMVPARRAYLEEWFRKSAQITSSEPGAIWTLRALRALPNLAHVRLESLRRYTDQMFEFYHHVYPEIPPKLLWCRIRVVNEFGFAVEEMALEEDRVPPEVLFHEVARILGIPYDYEPP